MIIVSKIPEAPPVTVYTTLDPASKRLLNDDDTESILMSDSDNDQEFAVFITLCTAITITLPFVKIYTTLV